MRHVMCKILVWNCKVCGTVIADPADCQTLRDNNVHASRAYSAVGSMCETCYRLQTTKRAITFAEEELGISDCAPHVLNGREAGYYWLEIKTPSGEVVRLLPDDDRIVVTRPEFDRPQMEKTEDPLQLGSEYDKEKS